jgi:hypothetical protein
VNREQRDTLTAYVRRRAEGGRPEKEQCCELDHGDSFVNDNLCFPCAEKRLAVLEEDADRDRSRIRGGPDHFDSPPYCEDCHIDLEGYLTNYGIDEELYYLSGIGAHLEPYDWARLEDVDQLGAEDERWELAARIAARPRHERVGADDVV